MEIYDHDGKAYNVTMEPGDMVGFLLYQLCSLIVVNTVMDRLCMKATPCSMADHSLSKDASM